MAKSLTLTFEGLCEFVLRGDRAEVYLPDGGGIHGQFLLTRSDFLDVPQTIQGGWMPAFVSLIRDFDEFENKVALRQIAVWSLEGLEVTVQQIGATGAPKWKDRTTMIDFKEEHAGASAKTNAQIRQAFPKVGVVTLIGGTTELVAETPTAKDNFSLRKGTATKQKKCSRLVQWAPKGQDNHKIERKDGKQLILRDNVNAWVTISNIAPVSATEGLTHFGHHYEGIALQQGDEQLKIEQSFADVFDCVPPAAWP